MSQHNIDDNIITFKHGNMQHHFIGRQQEKNIYTVITRWLLTFAMGFEIAVVALLLILSIIFTCTFIRKDTRTKTDIITELVDYRPSMPTIGFLFGCILLFTALFSIIYCIAQAPHRNTMLSLLAFITIMQILWIATLELTSYGYADSKSLIDGANAIISGDINRFSPNFCPVTDHSTICTTRAHNTPHPYAYFSYYPFQSGPMLWYVLVGLIFGANNIIAFQMLNAFAITGLVACLWRLGTLFGLDDFGRAALAVLLATCVPLLMFAAFVYPNAVGFSITLAGVALIAQAFRARRVWTSALAMVCGFLVCGIGIILKSTFIIVMLAAIIGVALVVLVNHKWWQGAVAVVSMAAAHMLTKLPLRIIEHVTQQDFGKGMPMLSWITLGLNERKGTTPGWWTGIPLRTFHETNGDYEQQTQIAKDFIIERMQHFLHDPSDAVHFFSAKLSSEWAEPSFMTSYYSQLGSSAHHFTGAPQWLIHGKGSQYLTAYENTSQTILYALALVGVIATLISVMRSTTTPMEDSMIFARTFLCAAFLGGFICYLFWEAKGIYTLPFYLLLFPVAAYGLQTTARMRACRHRTHPRPARGRRYAAAVHRAHRVAHKQEPQSHTTPGLLLMAEDARFELARLLHQHAFQACAIGH